MHEEESQTGSKAYQPLVLSSSVLLIQKQASLMYPIRSSPFIYAS